MSAPHVIVDCFPSLCQTLSELVQKFQKVMTKTILLCLLDTVYSHGPSHTHSYRALTSALAGLYSFFVRHRIVSWVDLMLLAAF